MPKIPVVLTLVPEGQVRAEVAKLTSKGHDFLDAWPSKDGTRVWVATAELNLFAADAYTVP